VFVKVKKETPEGTPTGKKGKGKGRADSDLDDDDRNEIAFTLTAKERYDY
jgi:hypothetical protein